MLDLLVCAWVLVYLGRVRIEKNHSNLPLKMLETLAPALFERYLGIGKGSLLK